MFLSSGSSGFNPFFISQESGMPSRSESLSAGADLSTGQPPTSSWLLMILPVQFRTEFTIRSSTESRFGRLAPPISSTRLYAVDASSSAIGPVSNGWLCLYVLMSSFDHDLRNLTIGLSQAFRCSSCPRNTTC